MTPEQLANRILTTAGSGMVQQFMPFYRDLIVKEAAAIIAELQKTAPQSDLSGLAVRTNKLGERE